MSATPPIGWPCWAQPAAFDPEAFHAVLADSRMLDEIGRGIYAGDDPVACALLAYRVMALGTEEMS